MDDERNFLTGNWRTQLHCDRRTPITPVSGRVKTAEFCTAESGVYEGGFRQVFGRVLERPAGRSDANAQLL
jgi:hypothetical protein